MGGGWESERKAGTLLVAGADGSSVAREFSGYAADKGRGRNSAGSGCGVAGVVRRHGGGFGEAARPASEKAMYLIVVRISRTLIRTRSLSHRRNGATP